MYDCLFDFCPSNAINFFGEGTVATIFYCTYQLGFFAPQILYKYESSTNW